MISSDILEKSLNKEISYEAFFHAFGYKDNNVIYFRNFVDNAESPVFLALPPQDQERALKGINSQTELWDINAILPTLHKRNAAALGVYFIVNGGGNNDAEVKSSKIARAQFMEIDDTPFPEQLERIRGFPLEPSVIIKTKKSLHTYWLLDEGNIKHFREIQQRLIQHFGADTSNVNESRVMRLYGFDHMKAEPCQVTLIKFNPDLRYTQKQLVEVLPEYDKKFWDNTKRLPHISGLQSAEGEAITYGNRHVTMCSVGLSLLMRYGDTEKAQERFLQHSMRCEPLLPERDLSRIWNNTRSKYYRDIVNSPDYLPPEEYEKSLQKFPPGRDGTGSHGTATEAATADQEQKQYKPLGFHVASELKDMKLEPVRWLADDLIAEGQVTLIGAKRKLGKSWFNLQLALAICQGGEIFGHRCQKAGVLYIDTEGTMNRIKGRLNKQLSGGIPPNNLIIVDKRDLKKYFSDNNAALQIGNGFEHSVADVIQRNKDSDIRLVIIDILQHVLPEQGRTENDYSFAYRVVNTLQGAAGDSMAFLLVMHTRKAILATQDGDPFDELLGSTGWSGAAETLLTFRKNRKTEDIHFYSQGRDIIHEEDIVVKLDREGTLQWLKVGNSLDLVQMRNEEEYRNSAITQTIKKLIVQAGGQWEGTASEIKEASKFFTAGKVWEDIRAIGNFISKHEEQFQADGIRWKSERRYKEGKRQRKYSFSTLPAEDEAEQEEMNFD